MTDEIYDDDHLRGKVFGGNEQESDREDNTKDKNDRKRGKKSRKEYGVAADEDKPPEYYTQKYQQYEAILLDEFPYFLELVDGQVILHEEITLPDMSLKPLNRIMYLNRSYAFKSIDEINQYVNKASSETFDTVYKKVKSNWSKYIDADNNHLSLCAADTIFTYFQDKFGLTHYLLFVGDNGTGKSNNLKVFQYLGYRALFDTSITSANIYQFLGSLEEGQGIILEDEADNIDQNFEKMKVYKSGYESGTKVTRTDLSNGRKQDGYWTYSFKAFSAERSPSSTRAKGFNERVFVLPCSAGSPQYDIAEVINPVGDQKYTKLVEELEDLHKLLLIFRLSKHKKVIPDIELNIKNRDKQLSKPLIRLFQNADCRQEIMTALSKYLTEKRERKTDTLDARLFDIIINLIGQEGTTKLTNEKIWQSVKDNIEGNYDKYKPLSYETEEFYTLSLLKVSTIFKDKFGAVNTRIRVKDGYTGDTTVMRGLEFNQEKLNALGNNYGKLEAIEIIENKGVNGVNGS